MVKQPLTDLLGAAMIMTKIPSELFYTKEHEWMSQEGALVRVGITDYAQEELHEVVMVELPTVGTTLKMGEVFGTVDSVKATSELFSPISGEVVERNEQLEEAPELVNNDPYGKGWMIVIKPSNPSELKMLMNADAYSKFVKELAK